MRQQDCRISMDPHRCTNTCCSNSCKQSLATCSHIVDAHITTIESNDCRCRHMVLGSERSLETHQCDCMDSDSWRSSFCHHHCHAQLFDLFAWRWFSTHIVHRTWSSVDNIDWRPCINTMHVHIQICVSYTISSDISVEDVNQMEGDLALQPWSSRLFAQHYHRITNESSCSRATSVVSLTVAPISLATYF